MSAEGEQKVSGLLPRWKIDVWERVTSRIEIVTFTGFLLSMKLSQVAGMGHLPSMGYLHGFEGKRLEFRYHQSMIEIFRAEPEVLKGSLTPMTA